MRLVEFAEKQSRLPVYFKGSITAVYDYVPLVTVNSADPLQRFGFVKVEGTSFTVSEPYSVLEIEPVLYTLASQEQKEILRKQYGVGPFQINIIQLERIFADKIFAAEFYYERAMSFDYVVRQWQNLRKILLSME